jgi:putative tricarboxylic transport membrane protein
LVEISALFHGFAVVLSPFNLLLMLVGIVLGVIIGVLPGLGGANGVASSPLTFTMRRPRRSIAVVHLLGRAVRRRDHVSAVQHRASRGRWRRLRRLSMAQQGAPARLTASFTSSFIGALFAVILITFLAPLVTVRAQVRAAGTFSVYLLTFCSFIGMGKGSPWKTLASMMLGFARAVGMDNITDRCASPSASRK